MWGAGSGCTGGPAHHSLVRCPEVSDRSICVRLSVHSGTSCACTVWAGPGTVRRGNFIKGVLPPGDGAALDGATGAYGFRFAGVPGAAALLTRITPDAPLLTIERIVCEPAIVGTGVGLDRAQFELEDDGLLALEIWRDPLRARFSGSHPPDDQALVHPFLVLAAATAAHWLDWEAVHAGGFRLGDAAWGVLGDRNAGKSSLLCGLSLLGVDVLADDLLVVADGRVQAGPNSVDLRTESARRLNVGEYLGVVGARERWRHVTPPSRLSTPLAGFVSLCWGERVELLPVPVGRRLQLLSQSSTLGLPPATPGRLLELAALPAWELRRPRDWAAHDRALTLLVDSLG